MPRYTSLSGSGRYSFGKSLRKFDRTNMGNALTRGSTSLVDAGFAKANSFLGGGLYEGLACTREEEGC